MSKFSTPNINDFVNKIPDEDLNFEPYTEQQLDPIARMAKNTYQDPNKRQDVGNYKYLQDESTDDLAVYENDDEYHISIRGTSPKTFVRDMIKDSAIALGTLGAPIFNRAFEQDIENVQNKINKFKLKKPVSISGHSKGGSVAGFVGVDNPDVRVTTFNRGDALPFVGDYIKCAINGCENINNYRISGDTAGLVGSKFSNQRYFNLKPRKPTKDMKETAETLKSTVGKIVNFYDDDYYLPHPIDNFLNRKKDKLLSDDTYARPLAAKLGAIGVGAAAAASIYGVKKYLQRQDRFGIYVDVLQQMQLDEDDPNFDPDAAPTDEQFDAAEGIAENIAVNIPLANFKDKVKGFTELRFGLGGMAAGGFIGQGIYDVVYGRDLDNPGEDEL